MSSCAAPGARLHGRLTVPSQARGVVVFAHGSGSSHCSPRNAAVASMLQGAGLGTLLFDLLTDDEADVRRNVFDIELLAERLAQATTWLQAKTGVGPLPVGYFGASTGAAAALVAAAQHPDTVHAVVSRGGRPDLAGSWLPKVTAPTLLIVGGQDLPVIDLNREAQRRLRCTVPAGDRARRDSPVRGVRHPRAGRAARPVVVPGTPAGARVAGGIRPIRPIRPYR